MWKSLHFKAQKTIFISENVCILLASHLCKTTAWMILYTATRVVPVRYQKKPFPQICTVTTERKETKKLTPNNNPIHNQHPSKTLKISLKLFPLFVLNYNNTWVNNLFSLKRIFLFLFPWLFQFLDRKVPEKEVINSTTTTVHASDIIFGKEKTLFTGLTSPVTVVKLVTRLGFLCQLSLKTCSIERNLASFLQNCFRILFFLRLVQRHRQL